jgi:hypothetical protein
MINFLHIDLGTGEFSAIPLSTCGLHWGGTQTGCEERGNVCSSLSSTRILGLSRVLTGAEALGKRFSERIFKLFKWDFVVVPAADLNMSARDKVGLELLRECASQCIEGVRNWGSCTKAPDLLNMRGEF